MKETKTQTKGKRSQNSAESTTSTKNQAKTQTKAKAVKMPSEKAKIVDVPTTRLNDEVMREDEKVKPSARVKKTTAKANKTAAKGIMTVPAYPDVSFPEGGNNGEIVGKSASPRTRRGK